MRDALSSDAISPAARKSELRHCLRRLRVAIPGSQRRCCARRAARQLARWRALRRARDVAVYLSVRSELSTAPLLARLLRRGRHRVWAPVTGSAPRMRFAPLRRHSCLRRGALGLPQVACTRPLRSAASLDLVLLPLLGFDGQGHRLGNGGGWYDRALAGRRSGRRPLLVGYAYAAQEIAAVPAEPWDVKLDAIATERGLRRFR
ncbi:MAG: 5-formyltetrahydrofolate cyclo-ligase [Nevskia sp.]|nr:5-formyltetrahydrofolate cyclo-ligase [Nevskia sp.]